MKFKKPKPLWVILAGAGLFLGYQLLKPKTAKAGSAEGGGGVGSGSGAKRKLGLGWNDAIEARVTSKAQSIYNQRTPAQQELNMAMIFTLARDTVMVLWPNEPWPQVPADLVDAAWVPAGPKGELLSTTFAGATVVAEEIYGFVPVT